MTLGDVICRKKPSNGAKRDQTAFLPRVLRTAIFFRQFGVRQSKQNDFKRVQIEIVVDFPASKTPVVNFRMDVKRRAVRMKNVAKKLEQGLNDVLHGRFIEMIGGYQLVDADQNLLSIVERDHGRVNAELQLMGVECSDENVVIDIGY